jgi:predicted N-acetyltransferase YhbS
MPMSCCGELQMSFIIREPHADEYGAISQLVLLAFTVDNHDGIGEQKIVTDLRELKHHQLELIAERVPTSLPSNTTAPTSSSTTSTTATSIATASIEHKIPLAKIIGHIMFSEMTIEINDTTTNTTTTTTTTAGSDKSKSPIRYRALALAPLCASPTMQRSGVGSALVRTSLERLRKLVFDILLLTPSTLKILLVSPMQ